MIALVTKMSSHKDDR